MRTTIRAYVDVAAAMAGGVVALLALYPLMLCANAAKGLLSLAGGGARGRGHGRVART